MSLSDLLVDVELNCLDDYDFDRIKLGWDNRGNTVVYIDGDNQNDYYPEH